MYVALITWREILPEVRIRVAIATSAAVTANSQPLVQRCQLCIYQLLAIT